jgi:hypothetical protein
MLIPLFLGAQILSQAALVPLVGIVRSAET